ncbi:HamA C-terminal domain-containing protein [Rhizobium laguerreae]|uniref:HamA C-terminal domain-containing protein n=1 Tax=Rhizobium laguerreae TaxID=1076926 RepID=UPI0028A95A77|nr:Hachiman antiphage defense system protein HamA [Rhizobium laguerreae]
MKLAHLVGELESLKLSMNIKPLVDPYTASDAGGVKARQGFTFQDHIAASFLLDLLSDPELLQVECETGDDIALRWLRNEKAVSEYVQVKITDGDSKWNLTEICARKSARVGTSLVETSLAADKFPGDALFRFVSTRGVNNTLRTLRTHRDRRFQPEIVDALTQLGEQVSKRLRKVSSPNERTVSDWVQACLWEVAGEKQAVQQMNINRIHRLFEMEGEALFASAVETTCDGLVTIARNAGDESMVDHATKKVISKEAMIDWWAATLKDAKRSNRAFLKVYKVPTSNFFTPLHCVEEPAIQRSLASYDVEFDDGGWRNAELARYLARWIPELILPPRVLAQCSHLQAHELVARTSQTLKDKSVDYDDLLSQAMLHAILRHHYSSEPTLCKLHSLSPGASDCMNGHIVFDPAGDQLWLGHARITVSEKWDEVTTLLAAKLESLVSRDFLRRERDLIIQYREPQHLRDTTLSRVFDEFAKLDDLIRVLNLPVLVAYDSSVLEAGFVADYVDKLKVEVERSYIELKNKLSPRLTNIRVHVFLVPIYDSVELAENFKRNLER